MLKFIFWILLLGNGALFAYHQGYLEGLIPSGREPARLAQQLDAGKIRLLPAETQPTAPPAPASPAVPANPAGQPGAEPASGEGGQAGAAPKVVAVSDADLTTMGGAKAEAGKPVDAAIKAESGKKPEAGKQQEAEKKPEPEQKAATADTLTPVGNKAELLACTEIGNFSEADAGRAESRLAALAPGARLSRRVIREAGSHMVYIPPQGTRENADRKVEQLRSLGVTDFYVIQDQSDMRWGISLGIFSSPEAAQKRLAQLKQQGVRSARIGARNTVGKVAFQLRALDAAGREKLEKIKADFPQQQQRNCA